MRPVRQDVLQRVAQRLLAAVQALDDALPQQALDLARALRLVVLHHPVERDVELALPDLAALRVDQAGALRDVEHRAVVPPQLAQGLAVHLPAVAAVLHGVLVEALHGGDVIRGEQVLAVILRQRLGAVAHHPHEELVVLAVEAGQHALEPAGALGHVQRALAQDRDAVLERGLQRAVGRLGQVRLHESGRVQLLERPELVEHLLHQPRRGLVLDAGGARAQLLAGLERRQLLGGGGLLGVEPLRDRVAVLGRPAVGDLHGPAHRRRHRDRGLVQTAQPQGLQALGHLHRARAGLGEVDQVATGLDKGVEHAALGAARADDPGHQPLEPVPCVARLLAVRRRRDAGQPLLEVAFGHAVGQQLLDVGQRPGLVLQHPAQLGVHVGAGQRVGRAADQQLAHGLELAHGAAHGRGGLLHRLAGHHRRGDAVQELVDDDGGLGLPNPDPVALDVVGAAGVDLGVRLDQLDAQLFGQRRQPAGQRGKVRADAGQVGHRLQQPARVAAGLRGIDRRAHGRQLPEGPAHGRVGALHVAGRGERVGPGHRVGLRERRPRLRALHAGHALARAGEAGGHAVRFQLGRGPAQLLAAGAHHHVLGLGAAEQRHALQRDLAHGVGQVKRGDTKPGTLLLGDPGINRPELRGAIFRLELHAIELAAGDGRRVDARLSDPAAQLLRPAVHRLGQDVVVEAAHAFAADFQALAGDFIALDAACALGHDLLGDFLAHEVGQLGIGRCGIGFLIPAADGLKFDLERVVALGSPSDFFDLLAQVVSRGLHLARRPRDPVEPVLGSVADHALERQHRPAFGVGDQRSVRNRLHARHELCGRGGRHVRQQPHELGRGVGLAIVGVPAGHQANLMLVLFGRNPVSRLCRVCIRMPTAAAAAVVDA